MVGARRRPRRLFAKTVGLPAGSRHLKIQVGYMCSPGPSQFRERRDGRLAAKAEDRGNTVGAAAVRRLLQNSGKMQVRLGLRRFRKLGDDVLLTTIQDDI